MQRILFILVLAATIPVHASAADLSKIDRTIKKEPAYKSKPKYCLLVIGPEVKTKVWLVLDDDTLYVDRNCNGDLTEDGERVAMPRFRKSKVPGIIEGREVKAGDIRDGRFTHIGLKVVQVRLDSGYKPTDRSEEMSQSPARSSPDGVLYEVSLGVELRSGQGGVLFIASADTQGFLHFADSPGVAPVIHLDGPWQMELIPSQELTCGDKPIDLQCWLGTRGLGQGTFASLFYVSNERLIPQNCHPVAEVDFPGKQRLAAKVALDERC